MTETAHLTAIDHHFANIINRLDSTSCDELWLAAALTSAAWLLCLSIRSSFVAGSTVISQYGPRVRTGSQVEIWGTEEVFYRAVEQRIVRNSGLRERLWGNGQGTGNAEVT